jgi:hypothetical protein
MQEELKEKRKNSAAEEDQGEKKKIVRYPEVYCVNKRKFWSQASEEELNGPIEFVPGGDNEKIHRIIQCKLR